MVGQNKFYKEGVMKKRVRIAIVSVMIGVASLSGLAYAQAPSDLTEDEVQMIEMHRKRSGEMRKKIQVELGLTQEQVQKLEAHRKANKGQAKKNREAVKGLRDQVKVALEAEEVDVQKIYSIQGKLKALENTIADDRLEKILEVRNILTPEQFKKFDKKFGEKKRGRGQMRKGQGDRNAPEKGEMRKGRWGRNAPVGGEEDLEDMPPPPFVE